MATRRAVVCPYRNNFFVPLMEQQDSRPLLTNASLQKPGRTGPF